MAISRLIVIAAVSCLVTAVWLRGLWSPTPPEVVVSRYTGKESPENNPGLHTAVDSATSRYFMQQIMLRVKDPKASLDFYTRVMGRSLIKRFDNPQQKSTLYFLGYEDLSTAPSDPIERTVWTVERKATLELAHSWGTESDPEFKGYHDGNSHPLGFGHIGITVDDVYKACERFESLGVNFIKKPTEGAIKGVAFIRDPDGYKIEIFDPIRTAKIVADLGSA